MNANLKQILKNLVQIPTENPPGKTDEIINYLITGVFKESDGFHNEVMNYKKKDVELKNLITRITHDLFVIGNENMGRFFHDGILSASGSEMMKTLPFPILLSTFMAPRCFLRIP